MPLSFPTPPMKPLRERIRDAQTIAEVQQIALWLLDEMERTKCGQQCQLCAAPCVFPPSVS